MSERFKGIKTFFSILNKIRLVIINIIFFYFLFLFLAGASVLMALNVANIPTINSGTILFVRPKGEIVEFNSSASGIMKFLSGSSEQFPVSAIVDSIIAAAYDRRVDSLVFDFSNISSLSLSTAFEIDFALQEFIKSGKPYFAFSTSYNLPTYFLASSARSIGLDPLGDIDLSGFAAETMFFGGLYEKTGLKYDVSKAGTHKGAADQYVKKGFTDEVRANYTELLENCWEYFVTSVVAKNKKLSREAVLQYAQNPLDILRTHKGNTGRALSALGFVSEVSTHREFMRNHSISDNRIIHCEDFYLTIPVAKSENAICVIDLEGGITQSDGGFQYSDMAVSSEVCSKIQEACEMPTVRAIVLRVNSGGGEVFASEVIRRKVDQAKNVYGLPIVVSMADTAASGAYWISSSADYIFANPFTITGSIGVLAAVMDMGEALEKYLGISSDMVYVGAKPFSTMGGLTRDEQELMQLQVDSIYETFLKTVSAGRGKTVESVEKIASGRVYSGLQAQNIGLVDEMGTLNDAIQYAAKLANIENDYVVTTIEKDMTILENLLDFALNNQISLGDISALRSYFELRSFFALTKIAKEKRFLVYEPFRLN